LINVFVRNPYTFTSSRTCSSPKYVSTVFAPETILSSMMSRAEWARKWYFKEGDGSGRGGAVERGTWMGVEGDLGKALR
jgi:hypothetical protein